MFPNNPLQWRRLSDALVGCDEWEYTNCLSFLVGAGQPDHLASVATLESWMALAPIRLKPVDDGMGLLWIGSPGQSHLVREWLEQAAATLNLELILP